MITGEELTMIEYIKMDITKATMGLVAHGVNCQQTMGSGVAVAIKKKWPQVYKSYMQYVPEGDTLLGSCDIIQINEYLSVANCYTQNLYGYGGGKYAHPDAVRQSLLASFQHCDMLDDPLYMPRIGCARGGLSWHDDVFPIITELNEKFDRVDVFVCDFQPDDENIKLNF